ncbi:hypothetical protein KSF_099570 [Reticulibacter mediterranei]|uniref:DDE domain-containing protein n=1 Tax=Reticulibacter mediterranei TaxID=2778369 RepID=A0A8J3N683_9CHLR|nr:hypothetical protein KSF_099570 [Reticulibacter mediterranei]
MASTVFALERLKLGRVADTTDETYLKVCGKWCYLYRAIDSDGNLVDSRLSEKRDLEDVENFFDPMWSQF